MAGDPPEPWAADERLLVSVGRLLRDLHRASTGYLAGSGFPLRAERDVWPTWHGVDPFRRLALFADACELSPASRAGFVELGIARTATRSPGAASGWRSTAPTSTGRSGSGRDLRSSLQLSGKY